MTRKLRSNKRLTSSDHDPNKKDDEDNDVFIFRVDPGCIITLPVDNSLYVCDICSTILQNQDSFRKHYIELHINHAFASISDLKFCDAYPMNNLIGKEDEGKFRCHFCVDLFFTEKNYLQVHLSQHRVLEKIPERKCSPDFTELKTSEEVKKNTNEVVESRRQVNNEIPQAQNSMLKGNSRNFQTQLESTYADSDIMLTLNELPPLPNPNLATRLSFSSKMQEIDDDCFVGHQQQETEYEPLSGLVGSSLHALFSPSATAQSDLEERQINSKLILSAENRLRSGFVESSFKLANIDKNTLPLFAPEPFHVEVFHRNFSIAQPVQREDKAVQTKFDSPLPNFNFSALSTPILPISTSKRETLEICHLSDHNISTNVINDVTESEQINFNLAVSPQKYSIKKHKVYENTSQGMTDGLNMDNIVLSCLFCEKFFVSIKATKTHMAKSHQSGKNKLSCTYCKKKFKNYDLMLNHLCSTHSDFYFACISCKVRFETKEFMDSHLQNKHNSENDKKKVCKISKAKHKDDILHQLNCIPYYTNQNEMCNSISKKIKQRVFNKLRASNQKKILPTILNGSRLSVPPKKVVSLNCQSQAETQLSLASNDLAFSKKSPDIEEEKCCQELKTFQIKVENVFEDLNQVGNYLCLYCDKMFLTVKGSTTHISKVHKLRRKGKNCFSCKSNFRTTSLLFQHLCSEHADIYFACIICTERFKSKDSLIQHLENKHGSVNVNDHQTTSLAKKSTKMSEHQDLNHCLLKERTLMSLELQPISSFEWSKESNIIESNEYDADSSTDAAVQNELLNKILTHKASYEGNQSFGTEYKIENHPDAFHCLFCNELFLNDIKACKRHMLITHEIEQHEKCMFCQTQFDYCDFLINHLRTSHQDQYFECNYCKVRLSTKLLLDRHIQNRHKGVISSDKSAQGQPAYLTSLVGSPVFYDPKKISDQLSMERCRIEGTNWNHRKLIEYNHPSYNNIAHKNYSGLELTVQHEVTKRITEALSRKKPEIKSVPQIKNNINYRLNKGSSSKHEYSGEWAQRKNYFCAICGAHFLYFWDFHMHRWEKHPLTTCSVFDFPIDHTPPCYFVKSSWPYNQLLPEKRSETEKRNEISKIVQPSECTKCRKPLPNSAILRHKHIIMCDSVPLKNLSFNTAKRLVLKRRRSPRETCANIVNKRKRHACRGFKSVLDTPPKVYPSVITRRRRAKNIMCSPVKKPERVSNRNSSQSKNSLQKVINTRRLDFNDNTAASSSATGTSVLLSPRKTRRQSVISDIDDEKTKELIEEFQRGKYNPNNL